MIQQIWHKDGIIMKNGLTPLGGKVHRNGELAKTKGKYESLVIIPETNQVTEIVTDNRMWTKEEVENFYEKNKAEMEYAFKKVEYRWIMFVLGVVVGICISILAYSTIQL